MALLYFFNGVDKMTKTTANIIFIVLFSLFSVTGLVMFMVPKNKEPEKVLAKVSEPITTQIPPVKTSPIKIVNPNPRDIVNKDLHEVDYNTVIPKVNNWAYVIKNPSLEELKKSNIDLIVVDTELKTRELTKDDVSSLKTKPNGTKRVVLAYLSLGMAEDYRSYWKDEWAKTAPVWLGQKHKIWKGNFYLKDVMAPEWTSIVAKLIDSTMEKGFDGIVVDGLTNVTDKFKLDSFLSLVAKRLKDNDGNRLLIVQDIDSQLKSVQVEKHIDGVIRQGLVYSPLSNGLRGKKNDQNVIDEDIVRLKEFAQKNKLVFVVEYVSGKQWSDVKSTLTDLPFVLYSAPLELDKLRKQQ